MDWVKSSYSNNDGGQCVEWAPTAVTRTVPVRDSKAPEQTIAVAPASWSAFISFATDHRH